MSRIVLSIVIVSYNTREYLERCLGSIERNSPEFSVQVVVVDNGSRDGSAEMVRERFPSVQLLANRRNAGFGPALNQGIRAVDSDFVLLLNSDTEVLSGTLSVPVREMQGRPEIGMAAPLFVDGSGRIIHMSWAWTPLFFGEILQRAFSPAAVQTKAWRRRLVERLQARERVVPTLCGAAMFVRREALDRAGGLDEGFVLYFEDSDLCVRVRKLGWRLLFLPQVRIIHHLGRSTASKPGKMTLLYRQSQLRFYRKHGTDLDRLLLRLYLWWKFRRIPVGGDSEAPADQREFGEKLRGVLRGTERVEL